jgi:hypothetical protein
MKKFLINGDEMKQMFRIDNDRVQIDIMSLVKMSCWKLLLGGEMQRELQ